MKTNVSKFAIIFCSIVVLVWPRDIYSQDFASNQNKLFDALNIWRNANAVLTNMSKNDFQSVLTVANTAINTLDSIQSMTFELEFTHVKQLKPVSAKKKEVKYKPCFTLLTFDEAEGCEKCLRLDLGMWNVSSDVFKQQAKNKNWIDQFLSMLSTDENDFKEISNDGKDNWIKPTPEDYQLISKFNLQKTVVRAKVFIDTRGDVRVQDSVKIISGNKIFLFKVSSTNSGDKKTNVFPIIESTAEKLLESVRFKDQFETTEQYFNRKSKNIKTLDSIFNTQFEGVFEINNLKYDADKSNIIGAIKGLSLSSYVTIPADPRSAKNIMDSERIIGIAKWRLGIDLQQSIMSNIQFDFEGMKLVGTPNIIYTPHYILTFPTKSSSFNLISNTSDSIIAIKSILDNENKQQQIQLYRIKDGSLKSTFPMKDNGARSTYYNETNNTIIDFVEERYGRDHKLIITNPITKEVNQIEIIDRYKYSHLNADSLFAIITYDKNAYTIFDWNDIQEKLYSFIPGKTNNTLGNSRKNSAAVDSFERARYGGKTFAERMDSIEKAMEIKLYGKPQEKKNYLNSSVLPTPPPTELSSKNLWCLITSKRGFISLGRRTSHTSLEYQIIMDNVPADTYLDLDSIIIIGKKNESVFEYSILNKQSLETKQLFNCPDFGTKKLKLLTLGHNILVESVGGYLVYNAVDDKYNGEIALPQSEIALFKFGIIRNSEFEGYIQKGMLQGTLQIITYPSLFPNN